MSAASQALSRTIVVSPIGGRYVDTTDSPFNPLDPLISAPHLVDHLEVTPTTGAIQPNGNPVFELPLQADLVTKITLRMSVDSLAANGGTFARYVDFVGLQCWQQLQVLYGTERLQTVRPDETYAKIHLMFDDEERDQAQQMLKGGLTPAQRQDAATNNPNQRVFCPFYTLLGLHIGGDPSQNIFVRGIGERIKLQLQMTGLNQWVEADGTFDSGNTGVVAAGAATVTGDVVRAADLYCEYQNIYDFQRMSLEMVYSQFRRYEFSDQQPHGPGATVVGGATLLNGASTANVQLREFTQPIETIVVLPRWAADLDRRVTGAGGTRGRNAYNFGWYNAGGVAANLPIIDRLQVTSGPNNFALRSVDVETLFEYEMSRKFKGSNRTRPSILAWTYSHDPTMENAVRTFIVFPLLTVLVVRLTLISLVFSRIPGFLYVLLLFALASDLYHVVAYLFLCYFSMAVEAYQSTFCNFCGKNGIRHAHDEATFSTS